MCVCTVVLTVISQLVIYSGLLMMVMMVMMVLLLLLMMMMMMMMMMLLAMMMMMMMTTTTMITTTRITMMIKRVSADRLCVSRRVAVRGHEWFRQRRHLRRHQENGQVLGNPAHGCERRGLLLLLLTVS